jgi:hypothetical protein
MSEEHTPPTEDTFRAGSVPASANGSARPREERSGPREAEPPSVELDPKPRIAKLSRTAFLGAALLGLVVLTVLSFRYSRESLSSRTQTPEPTGPAPLAAEQLERLRPPATPTREELLGLERADEQPVAPTAPAPPPPAPHTAPRPRPASPRTRPSALRRTAPLAVSLPSREGGGRSGQSDLASSLLLRRTPFASGPSRRQPVSSSRGAPMCRRCSPRR